MNEAWRSLTELVPAAPSYRIDWTAIEHSSLSSWFDRMKNTPQEPKWHGEGDVWRHTQLVCEALASMEAFRALDRRRQCELFVAALLHDVGKPRTTMKQDGEIRAPRHSAVGASIARTLLWTQFGLCGCAELQQIRETICSLIRWHMAPERIVEGDEPVLRALRMAAQGELIGDFTFALLCMLAEADIRGRIADDTEELLMQVDICREFAREQGCYVGPGKFASDCTKRAFLSGRQVWTGQALYDDTWGEVVMMCGLPGTGKDTWIAARFSEMETVSLDDMRIDMDVSPDDNQGAVVQACKERARTFLRRRQPFVFNATNLTATTRDPLVHLFEQYGARVRIIYLETTWEEQMRRNRERERQVPEGVIASMLDKLIPPLRMEARHVEWFCV